jgi:hypothetical protein
MSRLFSPVMYAAGEELIEINPANQRAGTKIRLR